MKYVLISLIVFAVSCKSPRYTPQYVETTILGTWTQAQDTINKAFRFERADTLIKFSKGFTFYKNGDLIMYLPWGCQSPPSFREMKAKWEVNKKGQLVIDYPLLLGGPVCLKIQSLTNKELIYNSSVIL